jgi:hypothetical protein
MMPAFPSPPLKFRTVGSLQYGFKASLSDHTFPHPDAVKCAPHMPAPRPGLCRPSPASATRSSMWLCVHIRRRFHEPLCERPCLSTPGVLGSGSGYVVPIPHRLLRPHPPVSPARDDFTAPLLIRRVFAVRERRGNPRDLPYFRRCAFHTCRRPYAGGSEAPTRCVRTPLPGFLVLSLSRHPRDPSLPVMPDGVIISALHRSRHAAARVFAKPS